MSLKVIVEESIGENKVPFLVIDKKKLNILMVSRSNSTTYYGIIIKSDSALPLGSIDTFDKKDWLPFKGTIKMIQE